VPPGDYSVWFSNPETDHASGSTCALFQLEQGAASKFTARASLGYAVRIKYLGNFGRPKGLAMVSTVSGTSSLTLQTLPSGTGSRASQIAALEKQIATKEDEAKAIADAAEAAVAAAEIADLRAELAALKQSDKASEEPQSEEPSRQAEFDDVDPTAPTGNSYWV
jgi:hypothetical protein